MVNILSPRKIVEVKPAEEELAIGEEAEEPEVITKEEEQDEKTEKTAEKESSE